MTIGTLRDYLASGGKLPDFADGKSALAEALPALSPPARISVSEAAEKYRRLDTPAYRGPWRNDAVPYMVEPADMIVSRRYNANIFVGPARTGKTDSQILNAVAHAVTCNPRNALIVHINKDAARTFSLEKLGPMIMASDPVRQRLLPYRGSDNIFDKRFSGGMRLSIGFPVIGQLSARDLPLVMMTDYDRMDDDVGEEGDPFSLARKRTQTFGSLGMTVVESSPGRPILDEGWLAATPHQAPPTTGILSIYNRGTRGRRYWKCPDCGEEFMPLFAHLKWPDSASPATAAAETVMACPHCGSLIEHGSKRKLDADGRWLHETADGRLVEIASEEVRPTDIVSYWLPACAAAFQTWGEMVLRFLEAKAHYERTGDETNLKATVNVDQGEPYLSRALADTASLTEDGLKLRAEPYPAGEVPAAARFVTVQIDVQGRRFVCQVDAWGPGLERWLVDRFDLHTPPEKAPGADARALDPARYEEDWDVLLPLIERSFPVTGAAHNLMPVALAVDSSGEPGVTERAYKFWRRCRGLGLGNRVYLIKGAGGFSERRAALTFPETANRGRRAVARDVRILRVGTDRLKDEVAASLTRKEVGPGYYHLPSGVDPAVFMELAAERRTATGWERKAGGHRNEALDLAVYGKALAVVLQAERIDWEKPPAWAATGAANERAANSGGTQTKTSRSRFDDDGLGALADRNR